MQKPAQPTECAGFMPVDCSFDWINLNLRRAMGVWNDCNGLVVDWKRPGTSGRATHKGIEALREIGSRYGRRGGVHECKLEENSGTFSHVQR